MRTGGQGQAAVLRERADRRRAPLSAWTGTLGRGRRSRGLSQICGALSRGFPRRSMPGWGGCLACHGRVPRSWLFVCANLGRAGPERVKWRETRNEKNENLAAPAGGAGAGGHGHDHGAFAAGEEAAEYVSPFYATPLGPAAPGGGHWDWP